MHPPRPGLERGHQNSVSLDDSICTAGAQWPWKRRKVRSGICATRVGWIHGVSQLRSAIRALLNQLCCLLNIPEASSGLTSPPRSRRTHLRDDCPGLGGTCGEDSESRRLPSPSPLPSPRTPTVKFNRPSTDEWAACTVPAASAAGFYGMHA